MIGDMSIVYTGLSLKVSLANGVGISWDGLWAVEVSVPKGLNTCGLCGDNDGKPCLFHIYCKYPISIGIVKHN